jgi:hypothetical protein
MKRKTTHLAKTIFIATCLTLGCTGSGVAGCGSDSGDSGSKIDSQLIGIYAIDSFQASPLDPGTGEPVPDSCDQLADSPQAGDFLVIYSFQPTGNPNEPRLGGAFCGSVDECRSVAKAAAEPAVGYSFIQGSDAVGWTGYAIPRSGAAGDQCQAEVQVHSLTSSGQSININTDTVNVIFMPNLEGDQAMCRNADALRALTPDLPCESRFVLSGTREANL